MEYVDLGLPSGLLWAKYNLGATNENEVGLYFQWGDTVGYTAEQIKNKEKRFELKKYKFNSNLILSKYNDDDKKLKLDLKDDAAHIMLGDKWRIPTLEDFLELCKNTDIFLVLEDGKEIETNIKDNSFSSTDYYYLYWSEYVSPTTILSGCKFYKKDDHSTYLFLPVTGRSIGGMILDMQTSGRYWSSTRSNRYINQAFRIGFDDEDCDNHTVNRYYGFPIRAVCNRLIKQNNNISELSVNEKLNILLKKYLGKKIYSVQEEKKDNDVKKVITIFDIQSIKIEYDHNGYVFFPFVGTEYKITVIQKDKDVTQYIESNSLFNCNIFELSWEKSAYYHDSEIVVYSTFELLPEWKFINENTFKDIEPVFLEIYSKSLNIL